MICLRNSCYTHQCKVYYGCFVAKNSRSKKFKFKFFLNIFILNLSIMDYSHAVYERKTTQFNTFANFRNLCVTSTIIIPSYDIIVCSSFLFYQRIKHTDSILCTVPFLDFSSAVNLESSAFIFRS